MFGFGIKSGSSVDEMLTGANLNWRVQRRAIAMRDGAGKALVTAPLDNYRAIVRSDNDEVFQVSTDSYHPVQNREIVEFFKQWCDAGHIEMESVGALKGGAIVFAQAKLNGGTNANLGGVDKVTGRLLMATSHDGSIRTIAKPCQTRVVCENTLMMAIGEAAKSQFRMKHTRKWTPEVAKEAKSIMGIAIEQIQKINEVSAKLAKATIDDNGRLEFLEKLLLSDGSLLDAVVEDQQPEGNLLDAVLAGHELREVPREDRLGRVGKAILSAIIDSPGADLVTAKNTLWGAINGVTHYVDHTRGRNEDNRLANAWFGAGNTLKTDAMSIAMQMAGIN